MSRTGYPCVCHPGRPVLSKGLCAPCSQFLRKANRIGDTSERAIQCRQIVADNEARKTAFAVAARERKEARRRAAPNFHSNVREQALRKRYGIGNAEYAQMLESQDSRCAICRSIPKHVLFVDHDHRTGAVRGLLCASCNVAMGVFDKGEAYLSKLCEYSSRFDQRSKP